VRLILLNTYGVTELNLYSCPKRPDLIDLRRDAVQGQLRPSPKGSSTSLPPLPSVPSIVPTLESCPASASPELIERREYTDEGNDHANGRNSLYVIFPFGWCVPCSFGLCSGSEVQTRKSTPAIVQPPTPPPSLSSPPTPLYSSGDPPSLLVLSVSRGNLKRKFVDDNDTSNYSINPMRRAPHFPCVLHLIFLHIKH